MKKKIYCIVLNAKLQKKSKLFYSQGVKLDKIAKTGQIGDSAMITEEKVTEIFCIADDFCKVFDAQMAKYSFKAERKRKYHRESRFFGFKLHLISRC